MERQDMPLQRCKDLRACLVTVNTGASKETEDKAVERNVVCQCMKCVILQQKGWVDWVMLKKQQLHVICFGFALVKRK